MTKDKLLHEVRKQIEARHRTNVAALQTLAVVCQTTPEENPQAAEARWKWNLTGEGTISWNDSTAVGSPRNRITTQARECTCDAAN